MTTKNDAAPAAVPAVAAQQILARHVRALTAEQLAADFHTIATNRLDKGRAHVEGARRILEDRFYSSEEYGLKRYTPSAALYPYGSAGCMRAKATQ